ncbi:MAG TPA: septum formation initiator family protein [Ktedonobacterales bacterium]
MPRKPPNPPERRRASPPQHPAARRPAARPEVVLPLGDGPEGPRRAALREEREEALALIAEPRPPLISRVIVWCTVIICLLLLLATFGQAWNVYGLNQQVITQQQAVQRLEDQNQQLQSAIQVLQEPDTIEQEARRLGYIYPGDQPVVVIVSGTPPPVPPAPPAKPTPPPSNPWGFWSDWLKFFFGG